MSRYLIAACMLSATCLLWACGGRGGSTESSRFARAFEHYLQGARAMDNGKLDAAAARFETAITLQPDFADVYCLLGETYLKQGHADQAVIALQTGIQLGPKSNLIESEAYLYLSDALLATGDLDGALGAVDESLTRRPESAPAHRRRARLLGQLGRSQETAEALRRYRELAPHGPDAGTLGAE